MLSVNLKSGAAMQVKICGITNVDDALLCCELGADALGFIFFEKSERYINYVKATEIITQLPPFVLKVGIFVNPVNYEINDIVPSIGLNAVQLHGDESPAFIEQINLPVIKGFRVKNDFEYSKLENFKKCSFLLDAYSPDNFGGTGITFDWSLIPQKFRDKIILAGGISSENIEHIYTKIHPIAVDLSSSVEFLPGRKDPNKLKEFFNKVNKLRYKC
jgi:phosphoribosylanthranilate isomerase